VKVFLYVTALTTAFVALGSAHAADAQASKPTKVECQLFQLGQAEATYVDHDSSEREFKYTPGHTSRVESNGESYAQEKKDILSDPDPCAGLSAAEQLQIVEGR
jgi:hypothetical protein